MKIVFFLNTPAQVHLHKNTLRELSKNHHVIILARDYGDTLNLLDEFNIPYFVHTTVPKSKYGKILKFPSSIFRSYFLLKKNKPDLIIGAGLYSAYTSQLLRVDCILFIDSMPTNESIFNKLQYALYKPFVKSIITPEAVVTPNANCKSLGKKHIKINTYKELAYLHQNYFSPDEGIYKLLNIPTKSDFVLFRFNAFDCIHDLGGVSGFSLEEKRILISEIGKHNNVFISSEQELPGDLQKFSLNIPKNKIHDVLYYAKLVVADTGTIVTEAAVLGTPAIRYSSNAGKSDLGVFIELQDKYNLIFSYDDSKEAIKKAIEISKEISSKDTWILKREQMLKDKIDTCSFMKWFIENYPSSFKLMQANPEIQYKFM